MGWLQIGRKPLQVQKSIYISRWRALSAGCNGRLPFSKIVSRHVKVTLASTTSVFFFFPSFFLGEGDSRVVRCMCINPTVYLARRTFRQKLCVHLGFSALQRVLANILVSVSTFSVYVFAQEILLKKSYKSASLAPPSRECILT